MISLSWWCGWPYRKAVDDEDIGRIADRRGRARYVSEQDFCYDDGQWVKVHHRTEANGHRRKEQYGGHAVDEWRQNAHQNGEQNQQPTEKKKYCQNGSHTTQREREKYRQ